MTLYSYPKVYQLGHPLIKEVFDDPVVIQEKIDGSQFSFGISEAPVGTVGGGSNSDDVGTATRCVECRSRGGALHLETSGGLFGPAMQTVLGKGGDLNSDFIYRAEAVCKPKHNVLTYSRVPLGGLILYDISLRSKPESYLPWDQVQEEAKRLGLEVVPTYESVRITGTNELEKWMNMESVLGGTTEGVVAKNYAKFGPDSKPLFGKYVNPKFKESHAVEWKSANPGLLEQITAACKSYRTEARWQKAVQHKSEEGTLLHEPKDIGPLIKELQSDSWNEVKDEIVGNVTKLIKRDFDRIVVQGFPEWYKTKLMERQFNPEQNVQQAAT